MNTREPYLILTAERKQYTSEINKGRMKMLKSQLTFRRIEFYAVCVGGVDSYICFINDGDPKFDGLLSLARRYGQRGVAYTDANGYSTRILLNEGNGGVHIMSR